jgi:hypothetical protein
MHTFAVTPFLPHLPFAQTLKAFWLVSASVVYRFLVLVVGYS